MPLSSSKDLKVTDSFFLLGRLGEQGLPKTGCSRSWTLRASVFCMKSTALTVCESRNWPSCSLVLYSPGSNRKTHWRWLNQVEITFPPLTKSLGGADQGLRKAGSFCFSTQLPILLRVTVESQDSGSSSASSCVSGKAKGKVKGKGCAPAESAPW